MSTQPTPEWQPIATAPKDGTRVLVLFYEDCVCSASYVEHPQGGNWYSEIGTSLLIEPARWMPLPPPPLPESSTEPKEGGETCPAPQPQNLLGSNAAAGTSNPFQQAASVQLPWLEQQQRDRETLAAETDQAPPQEPAGDGVKWPYNDPRFVGYFSGVPVNGRGHRIHPPNAPAVAKQELLPCPFCGKMPNVEECEEGQGVYVWCETKECPMHGLSPSRDKWNRRPAAPVAVGETPETAAKGFVELLGEAQEQVKRSELWKKWIDGTPLSNDVPVWMVEFAQNQMAAVLQERDAARRERDEARKIVRETSWMARRYADGRMTHAANTFNTAIEPAYSAGWLSPMLSNEAYARDGNFSGEWLSIEQQRDAATAERDELRHKVYMPADWCCDKCKFTWHRRVISAATGQIGAPIMEEVPTCPNDGEVMRRVTWVECAGDNQQAAHRALDERDALVAERDRLREEIGLVKEALDSACKVHQEAQSLLSAAGFHHGPDDPTPITLGEQIKHALTALATAQVNEANLCCVIAAAFAETAKPLNASVEYDTTPTAEERLKKVQEILSSAIDAADPEARDYQATQAEAAADKRRLDTAERLVIELRRPLGHGSEHIALCVPEEAVNHMEGENRPSNIRAALDAASATEAKRIPVKVRMAEDLGPDLWEIMAPNTPRFWVKKGDEVPVKCNQHGAMTLLTPHGELGVKPQECEIIEWQYPASATEGGQP